MTEQHDADPVGAVSAAVRAAHDAAVARDSPHYVDPETGFSVFTAAYLFARGRCCGSGCRHCPYDEEARRAAGRPGSA
ncbi:MAG TPA: DUF5522 domain-containing protein [Acidimicrobiales bacterium]|jgi:hypothetical protein|nr:DUF5522 domain-containing protein [Acidimicrobiales bacterium]